ncbi:MAG TPA: retroviral-like aspartic protease family protein [Casimicrobiaceae bacterium]|nr:retroviral-like aspartic protease family protein [Casimicrobiaceae bacterium]
MDRMRAGFIGAALALALTSASVDAASSCKLAQVAEWRVLSSRGIPVLEGFVNGRKVVVGLDTGGLTMMFRPASDRLGLTRQVARQYRVFGVGGETYVESAMVDEFRIGSLVRRNWQVMVAGERASGIDLLLGADVFDKTDVEFDLPHGAVRLFQPRDCEGVALAYWAPQTASQVDVEGGSRIDVAVRINGQAVRAELDSGSSTSVLDKALAEHLGLVPDSADAATSGKGTGVGAKTVDWRLAPLHSFAIGDETISDTVIRVADLWKDAATTSRGGLLPDRIEGTPKILLGSDFLRAHRVFVANSQHRMYFTYEGGPVFDSREQSAGRDAPSDPQAQPAEAAPPGGIEKSGTRAN